MGGPVGPGAYSMNQETNVSDRRRYEKRGIAIKAQAMNREPSEEMLESLRLDFSQKYGEGWKVDSVYPGAIVPNAHSATFEEGHMVIFKRRRQLRDE